MDDGEVAALIDTLKDLSKPIEPEILSFLLGTNTIEEYLSDFLQYESLEN